MSDIELHHRPHLWVVPDQMYVQFVRALWESYKDTLKEFVEFKLEDAYFLPRIIDFSEDDYFMYQLQEISSYELTGTPRGAFSFIGEKCILFRETISDNHWSFLGDTETMIKHLNLSYQTENDEYRNLPMVKVW